MSQTIASSTHQLMPGSAKQGEAPAMSTTLNFAVRRQEPELVGPAAPTPRETKRLSDIDDQGTLRRHVRLMFFYRGGCGSPRAGGDDPVRVIRRALGEALVPYYPLAGRLREVPGTRKLAVDCTGEGVMFVEADADVRMAELEAAGPLRPPFPCMDQLLFDVDGSAGVLHCPLLLIQVTRLLCGGFVLAIRLNHTMCDADGIAQFVSAVAELSRGVPAAPTVAPAWSRELLESHGGSPPPEPVFRHREYDAVPARPPPPGAMVMRTFTFSARDVAAIKKHLPPRLRDDRRTAATTSFEALVAVLWRARTAALGLAPGEDVRLAIVANCRRLPGLGLPDGYYGNAAVFPAAVTTAGALVGGSLGDAVELVRAAKAAVTAEYVRSAVDLLVRRGRPAVGMGSSVFLVSDNRRAGFHRVDFGWGLPVFGGVAPSAFGASFLIAVADGDGEEAVAVPIMLPRPAMDRFASEIEVALTVSVGLTAPPPRGRL